MAGIAPPSLRQSHASELQSLERVVVLTLHSMCDLVLYSAALRKGDTAPDLDNRLGNFHRTYGRLLLRQTSTAEDLVEQDFPESATLRVIRDATKLKAVLWPETAGRHVMFRPPRPPRVEAKRLLLPDPEKPGGWSSLASIDQSGDRTITDDELAWARESLMGAGGVVVRHPPFAQYGMLGFYDSDRERIGRECSPNARPAQPSGASKEQGEARPEDQYAADGPNDDGWHFEPGFVWFRRKRYEIKSTSAKLLKVFLKRGRTSFAYADLNEAWKDSPDDAIVGPDSIRMQVSILRGVLKRIASDISATPDVINDPLPYNRGGGWQFLLPKR
jgi:hypothetical protein